jgi:alcohol dehydrogenase YqhD (iron-dependent ADH family)
MSMEAFEYQLPTKIVFGVGRYAETGALCAPIGKKVLLHYGGGSIKKSGLYDRVKKSLADAGCSVVELGGVQPNPRLALVREGIALCKREGVEMILAVGGGSVIDSAKGIAAGVCYDGDVWDCYTGKAPVAAALPLGVVLTIPAAGSECSDVSVVTRPDSHDKRSFHAAAVTPRFAIIAPDVFTTLPRNQIANATVDVISHVMERFFSDSTHVTLTDRLCIATIETAMQLGLWLYDHPDDLDAWAEFALTANIAHNGVLGQGRIEDWGAHGIGHELSAFYDVAHGASLAIAIPAWSRRGSCNLPARSCTFTARTKRRPPNRLSATLKRSAADSAWPRASALPDLPMQILPPWRRALSNIVAAAIIFLSTKKIACAFTNLRYNSILEHSK